MQGTGTVESVALKQLMQTLQSPGESQIGCDKETLWGGEFCHISSGPDPGVCVDVKLFRVCFIMTSISTLSGAFYCITAADRGEF